MAVARFHAEYGVWAIWCFESCVQRGYGDGSVLYACFSPKLLESFIQCEPTAPPQGYLPATGHSHPIPPLIRIVRAHREGAKEVSLSCHWAPREIIVFYKKKSHFYLDK